MLHLTKNTFKTSPRRNGSLDDVFSDIPSTMLLSNSSTFLFIRIECIKGTDVSPNVILSLLVPKTLHNHDILIEACNFSVGGLIEVCLKLRKWPHDPAGFSGFKM